MLWYFNLGDVTQIVFKVTNEIIASIFSNDRGKGAEFQCFYLYQYLQIISRY